MSGFPNGESPSTAKGKEGNNISHVPILDRELCNIGVEPDNVKIAFVNEKKALGPDTLVDLYHGMKGGLKGALAILESPSQGVREFDGPCLSLYPLGQYWKPGEAGFHYRVPRRLLQFHGENNPNAKFLVTNKGIVYLINGLESVSVTKFDGEVMRTIGKEYIYEIEDGSDRWNGGRVSRGTDKILGERVVELTDTERDYETKIIEKLTELKSSTTNG